LKSAATKGFFTSSNRSKVWANWRFCEFLLIGDAGAFKWHNSSWSNNSWWNGLDEMGWML